MLKRLAIVALCIAYPFGHPSVAENQHVSPHAVQDKSGQTQGPVPPTHVIIDPPFPSPKSDTEAPPKPNKSPEPLLPNWKRPEWVIVDITAVYVLISAITFWAIWRQAKQMFCEEDIEAIIERRKTLHAYGYICYGDISGNPLRRLKFCETVLNTFEGDQICDWWEGFAPPAYTGTEPFPAQEMQQGESQNPN